MKVYPVSPKSKIDLETISKNVLREFDAECLEYPKAVRVEKLIDVFMDNKYGWALDVREDLPSNILGFSDPKLKTICVSEESYQKITDGDGRCRFTGCHEFSHVVLHRTQMRMRMITLDPKDEMLFRTERENLKPYVDPEWQADYLAGALLMPQQAVLKLMSQYSGHQLVEKMVEKFKVSYKAGEVRLKKMPR